MLHLDDNHWSWIGKEAEAVNGFRHRFAGSLPQQKRVLGLQLTVAKSFSGAGCTLGMVLTCPKPHLPLYQTRAGA